MLSEKSDHQSTPNSNSNLNLDPGISTRNPRKSISGCKCILITLVVLVFSGVGLFFISLAVRIVNDISGPHRALYQNASLEDVTNRATVVRPLITHEETFDIAATVWIRKTQRMGHGEVFAIGENLVPTELGPGEAELGGEVEPDALETPLFSDIIFHKLRLTDKNIFTTVNFTLPTAIFRIANLSNYDLRGSFVLIPSSPSLLDHVTNYSSWMPDNIEPFAFRSWPFPLGSSEQYEKTLADRVIEDFGTTVPLLSFHDVHTRCYKPDEDSNNDYTAGSDEVIDDDEPEEGQAQDISNGGGKLPVIETTNGKPILEYHPYIITRTALRVVDQTKLFNRKAYVKAHKSLKSISCGQGVIGSKPSRYMCDRDYRTTGHWMTQVQVGTLSNSTGKIETELVYPPYMTASYTSAGPKDLLVIPVNRENCTEAGMKYTESTSSSKGIVLPEQDSIDVSWTISYSGRTPGKLLLGNFVGKPTPYRFNQSDHDLVKAQDSAELAYGLVGHKFSKDAHPRRRSFLMSIGAVCSVIAIFLDIRYWYTRTSTVSISILGTALIAGSEMFVQLASEIAKWRPQGLSIPGLLGVILFTTCTWLVLPLLMLKAIARVDFGWWKGTRWIPVLWRAPATHRERASTRLEAKTPWHVTVGFFCTLVIAYYSFSLHRYFIIPANLPAPAPGDFAKDWLADISPFFILPLYVTGRTLQLVLNWRSRSYAGNYKVTAILVLAAQLTVLAGFVPRLVGRYDAREGLSMHELIDIALLLVAAWQAITLPSVSQTLDDDHVE